VPHDRFVPSFSLTQLSLSMYVLWAHKWQFKKLSKKEKKKKANNIALASYLL